MSQYTAPDEIPVMRGNAVIQRLSAAIVLASPSQYIPIFSKPRSKKTAPRLVCARIRERLTPWTPLANDGTGFRQMLDAGPVWALKGTSGSGKAQAAVAWTPQRKARSKCGSRWHEPMPTSAPRYCSQPGCSALVQGGKCAAHKAGYEKRRGTRTERGYDGSHRRLRVLCFVRDEWRCVDCGWEPELVRAFRGAATGLPPTDHVLEELRQAFNAGERHLHADHQIPIEERPDLRLDLDNLKTRCNVCHNSKSNKEMREGRGN